MFAKDNRGGETLALMVLMEVPIMKSRNASTSSNSNLDVSRFELFLNVFVRTPARGAGRRALRKR